MSHRMLKICLVVSLAANLLVLGAVGGFFGSGRHKDVRLDSLSTRHEARPRGPATSLGPLVRAMDREDRRDLGRMIQKAQGRDRRMDRDLRAQMTAVLADALRTEPFEPRAVLAVLQDEAMMIEERQVIARQALLDKLASMTPKAREQLAQALINGRK
ncbi:MAG: hypothetical protein ISP37_04715 [Planktomarina sp.]|uniref:hypothetical protein n=1 Tax=Planktomarina sp. TaxID=2024851 RepID=UPI003261C64E|nr:hypothetical protein [Planktomarina sp.]